MVKLVLKIELKDFRKKDDLIDNNSKNNLIEILKNDNNYFDSILISIDTDHNFITDQNTKDQVSDLLNEIV
jgi:hypothetical protein